jgi:hypothetical protein
MTTLAPCLMSRSEAAAYCGVTPATWSKWVSDGSMPKPVIGRRWDRKAIDLALAYLNPYPWSSVVYVTKVYFIECGDFVKIGYSANPELRLAALQVSTPHQMRLLGTIAGDHEVESRLHQICRVHHHKGEWFRKTGTILGYIERLLTRTPYRPDTTDFCERMAARFT